MRASKRSERAIIDDVSNGLRFLVDFELNSMMVIVSDIFFFFFEIEKDIDARAGIN